MTNTKAIYFDMDGTIADLYGIENWLNDLRSHSTRPYKNARPMVNMRTLARLLNRLQNEGWTIGIISWTSKDESIVYHHQVQKAKREWLNKHLASVNFNEINIVPYGWDKSECVDCPLGILFDDEVGNRENWKGTAYDVQNIIEVLKNL